MRSFAFPRKLGGWAVLCLVGLLFAAAPQSAFAEKAISADAKTVQAVFTAIDRNRFKDALKLIRLLKNPDLVRALVWSYLTAANTPATFKDLKPFLVQYQGWPQRDAMLKRAEETMPSSLSATETLDWFKTMGGPVSTLGKLRKAEAQLSLAGKNKVAKPQAIKDIRAIWVAGNFTKSEEDHVYRQYREFITDQDDLDRLDRLIWEERAWPAQRQMWKVDKKTRKLAVARLSLQQRKGNVDKAIADVIKSAPELANDPGLVYERLRWRRRKGRSDEAAEMFKDIHGDPIRPDKWWKERAIVARNMLQDNQPKSAYAITSQHGLSPDDAAEYSDAEWISGWIALRFLKDPTSAKKHFNNMLNAVSYPISVARGAYWSARAASDLGQKQQAQTMLNRAAEFSTTYYGQLARARLGQSITGPLSLPSPTKTDTANFTAHPISKAVVVLSQLGLQDRMRTLVLGLADSSDTPGWKHLAAAFASTHGRPDLAVKIAKESEQAGVPLGALGYPRLTPPQPKSGNTVETPLVLAVIRQESAFYAEAQSHAGARGLMQVMPATAQKVAKDNRIPYSRDKLLNDPHYNLIIGQVYLADMVEQFKGSYPMALAAYNAGPHRVKTWMRSFGDPRNAEVDIIDWVEMIPYSETRNYVQRVLENLGVYRATQTAQDAPSQDGAQRLAQQDTR
ncbi:lytic transglycosylase domain-containing protein [Magnetovibrio blakemorei]|uniref:lytic transglycosylase domain-containing protein n=1 Tax=Magnetovibrio blakemorei TaxID=28181 RepID=UPI0008597D42|nr:lytic transglycosylase domain-containing protein [Magnetovibrio blakemorei]